MNIDQIVVAIDEELARLKQVRALLTDSTTTTAAPQEPLGPLGRKPMSPEGRARIAAAQRKRWRAVNKAKKAASLVA